MIIGLQNISKIHIIVKLRQPFVQFLELSLKSLSGWTALNAHVAFPSQSRWESQKMSSYHCVIQIYLTKHHQQVTMHTMQLHKASKRIFIMIISEKSHVETNKTSCTLKIFTETMI